MLWELLTCEVPYKQLDSSAIMWGVGNNSLQLPIPSTSPEGMKLLIQQCWSPKPRNRPSFKIILTHLDIAGEELLRKYEDGYFDEQKTWRNEINDHMKSCGKASWDSGNNTNIQKYEQDLIRKRQDELKHAKDIRSIYERKLERTNNLYVELSACFLHLEEREKEILERERHVGKPYRKIVSSFRKYHFDKIARRRFCIQTPATPEVNSTTPSPVSTPNSPNKVSLYATLDSDLQPKSIILQPPVGNGSTNRLKKNKHRRVGSGSMITPKISPIRDRRTQSEPESRLKKLVDIQTQTEAMDLSETDTVTTIVNAPDQQLNKNELNTGNELKQRKEEMSTNTKYAPTKINVDTETTSEDEEEGDIDDNMPEDTTSSSQNMTVSLGLSSSMATSMLTSIMTESNLSYDNGNGNLNNFRECSDDDPLDQLDRKVRELSETASTISTVSSTVTIVNKNASYNCYCKNATDKSESCNIPYDSNNYNNNISVQSDSNLNVSECSCQLNKKANDSHDDVSPSWSDEEEGNKKSDYGLSTLRRKW